jgi:hypothetical protein
MVALRDAGAACPDGGTLVVAGLDRNRNGALDDDEVVDSAIICNGADGARGDAGEPGLTTLTRIEEDDPAECPAGGITILSGPDVDGDGILDPEEIDASQPLCHGENGADRTAGVVNIADVSAVTNAQGFMNVVFSVPCATQVPDLICHRGVLARDYDDQTAPVPVHIPAGTQLVTEVMTKSMTGFTVRALGPNGETLNNAYVNLFYIAVEFAQ